MSETAGASASGARNPAEGAFWDRLAGDFDPGDLPADVADLLLEVSRLYVDSVLTRLPDHCFLGVVDTAAGATPGLGLGIRDGLRRHFADTAKDLVRVLSHSQVSKGSVGRTTASPDDDRIPHYVSLCDRKDRTLVVDPDPGYVIASYHQYKGYRHYTRWKRSELPNDLISAEDLERAGIV